jgi:hypothetical protein
MTILGFILLAAGAVAAILTFLGLAPEALGNLPVDMKGWLGTACAGAVLMYLNRRPGN